MCCVFRSISCVSEDGWMDGGQGLCLGSVMSMIIIYLFRPLKKIYIYLYYIQGKDDTKLNKEISGLILESGWDGELCDSVVREVFFLSFRNGWVKGVFFSQSGVITFTAPFSRFFFTLCRCKTLVLRYPPNWILFFGLNLLCHFIFLYPRSPTLFLWFSDAVLSCMVKLIWLLLKCHPIPKMVHLK